MVGAPPSLAERQAEFERSSQRALRARKLKRVLPVAIGLFVLGLLAWPLFFARETGLTLSVSDISDTASQLRMTKPRFSGVDDKNQPFLITADGGVQDKAKAERVTLENVQADLTLQDGGWVTVKSPQAVFQAKPEMLDLPQKVELFSGNGYQIAVASGQIDLRKKLATSPGPVSGSALFGVFTARTMTLDLNDSALRFDGDVKFRFDPKEAQAAKQSQAAGPAASEGRK